jgi:pimeloyl-ACP methyl ester carboxylesterase
MAIQGKTETIDINGVEIRLTRKGEGPPLLLLHGGGGPMEQMPFADALAEKFEIVAPTHPGFAGTPIPKHYDGLPDLIFTYLDLLDRLALKDVTVVGVSLGGWLAAELAVLPGMPFSRVVLVDAVGVKHGGPLDRDIADIFGLPGPELAKLMWHDLSKAPDPSKLDDAALEIIAGNRTALALYGWEPYLHNPKLPHRLHRITAPTLVLWGESDRLVTAEYGRKYAALIPGAEFTAIPKAGHSPQAEQPEAFVKAIVDFAA